MRQESERRIRSGREAICYAIRRADAQRLFQFLTLCGRGAGGHEDLHRHALESVAVSRIGSADGRRLPNVARDSDRNKVCTADAPVSRIEADPPGARHKDFAPSVRRSGVRRSHERGAEGAGSPRQTRAASIISMAKSRQLPWPSRSVSTGGWIPFASRRL